MKTTSLIVGQTYEAYCLQWSEARGFGFLRVADGEDVFCHARELENAGWLNVGDRVRFEVRMDRRGRLFADAVRSLG